MVDEVEYEAIRKELIQNEYNGLDFEKDSEKWSGNPEWIDSEYIVEGYMKYADDFLSARSDDINIYISKPENGKRFIYMEREIFTLLYYFS